MTCGPQQLYVRTKGRSYMDTKPAFIQPLCTYELHPAVNVYSCSFGIFNLFGLAFMIFSYKSFKELK